MITVIYVDGPLEGTGAEFLDWQDEVLHIDEEHTKWLAKTSLSPRRLNTQSHDSLYVYALDDEPFADGMGLDGDLNDAYEARVTEMLILPVWYTHKSLSDTRRFASAFGPGRSEWRKVDRDLNIADHEQRLALCAIELHDLLERHDANIDGEQHGTEDGDATLSVGYAQMSMWDV